MNSRTTEKETDVQQKAHVRSDSHLFRNVCSKVNF